MHLPGYLSRIGATSGDDLATLVDRHLHAVPFENLSIHLGEEISTEAEALYDKIVVRRRGGFCYEQNGLLAWALGELGHDVGFLGARVDTPDGFTAPLAHQVLRVTTPDGDGPYLCDVGFGRFGLAPTPLDEPAPSVLRPADDGDLDVFDAGGELAFRVETHPRSREDFVPMCWWTAHSPDSPFTRSLICSLPTAEGGRVSLSGSTLLVTGPTGARTERELSADDTLEAYRNRFGIELDRLPELLYPAA